MESHFRARLDELLADAEVPAGLLRGVSPLSGPQQGEGQAVAVTSTSVGELDAGEVASGSGARSWRVGVESRGWRGVASAPDRAR